jgi:hypothetical protein
MYRADQNSYMLYPNRELKGFLEKNTIPEESIAKSAFLLKELNSGNRRFIERDRKGRIHFNGTLRNATELTAGLEKTGLLNSEEIDMACAVFEETFNHRQFTGRSGTFFKYEGLGCIYWHMVSKLLVAVQEQYFRAVSEGAATEIQNGLKAYYYTIREGLGYTKSPDKYGAFPVDPYSHTPGFAGVQQPGLTGQVKEDIITRFGELGVSIQNGIIRFNPLLLQPEEFISGDSLPLQGQKTLGGAPAIAFTLCEVPVMYVLGDKKQIEIIRKDGSSEILPGDSLTPEVSRVIFKRTGELERICVWVVL